MKTLFVSFCVALIVIAVVFCTSSSLSLSKYTNRNYWAVQSDCECLSEPSAAENKDRVLTNTAPLKSNIVVVYVGRWKFIQLQLPYLYRDLRMNGGLIDKVQFLMMKYEKKTTKRLTNFTETANSILGEEVFTINYMGYIPNIMQPGKGRGFVQAFYELCKQLFMNPQNRYFKFDDDIVYIHPEAFKNIIAKSSPDCEIHYFNIAGVNYICSWLHQRYGVFDEVNTKNFSFEKKFHKGCGYTNIECANFTMRTFLRFYEESKLEKYFVFDVKHLTERERFSINGFLLQSTKATMKFKEILENLKIESDEEFLSEQLKHTQNPPCIVGNALIVHFGYVYVTEKLVKLGLLQPFYELVEEAKDSFHMTSELWQILDGYIR